MNEVAEWQRTFSKLAKRLRSILHEILFFAKHNMPNSKVVHETATCVKCGEINFMNVVVG